MKKIFNLFKRKAISPYEPYKTIYDASLTIECNDRLSRLRG